MEEREKVVMLYTLLSFIKEIHDGEDYPGPFVIRDRLRYFEKTTEQLLGEEP